jgi:glycosyltransferase involved in cell wall biosynthesis
LSVIIPAYNVEKYIGTTLNSIVSQSTDEIEIIVVDDGSTDNTYKIAQNILKGKKNVKLIKKENGGVSSARNEGLRNAIGKYILFLDADDLLSNIFYDEIIKILNYEYDIIFWKYDWIDEEGNLLLKYEQKYGCSDIDIASGIEILKKMLISKQCSICTGSAVYNRELIQKNGILYTEGCSNGEDQEFTYKLLVKAEKVKFVNKTLSYYRQRFSSATKSFNIKRLENIQAFFRIAEYFKENEVPRDIIEYLVYVYIPEIFIRTFTSTYLFSKIKAKTFYSEFKWKYKDIIEVINNYLKTYKGKSKVTKLSINFFRKNPTLYLTILNIFRIFLFDKKLYLAIKFKKFWKLLE